MARIYDNIEHKFTDGLLAIITNQGVKRLDFCVGYFNLRGWNLVVNEIDNVPGDFVYENNERKFRCCRLLIGMHQPDRELVKRLYSAKKHTDSNDVAKYKLAIARDFKQQLLLGIENLCTSLMNDLLRNKFRKKTFYKATGNVIYDEYYPKLSKSIIDKIDMVLSKHYGFTEEELDFIINYDIKYRMGDELDNNN